MAATRCLAERRVVCQRDVCYDADEALACALHRDEAADCHVLDGDMWIEADYTFWTRILFLGGGG